MNRHPALRLWRELYPSNDEKSRFLVIRIGRGALMTGSRHWSRVGRASRAGSSQPRRAGKRRARPVAPFPAGPPAIGPGHNPDPAPADSKRGGRARCPTAPHGSVLSVTPRRAPMPRAGRRYLLVRRRRITPPATRAIAARATPPTRTTVLSPVCASPPPEPVPVSVPVPVPSSSPPGVVGSSPFYAHRPAGPPRRRRPDGTKRPRPRMNG